MYIQNDKINNIAFFFKCDGYLEENLMYDDMRKILQGYHVW